ncbi:MAG: hypothetical protein WC532_06460 [Candidatus Omnitrophota bacterium]
MPKKSVSSRYVFLAAILAYCFFTAVFFSPCLKEIALSLIGPAEDNLSHFWDIWWANKVFVGHSGSMAFSNYIFYPEGSSLLFQAFSFYNLFIAVILKQFISPVFAYNLLILSTFVLSGIGAFLLVRYLTKDPFAAAVGGFIFAFNPSHFAHSLHHIELATIQFIPFFVLYFIKALRYNSKKDLFLAGLFFALNSVSSLYYFVLGVIFVCLGYVYLVFRRRRFFLPDALKKSVLTLLPAVLILGPWLFKMAKVGLNHPETAGLRNPDIFVIDLLALIVPHPYHALADSSIFQYINTRFTGNPWEQTGYLGIISIVLVILAFKGIKKQAAKYFLAALPFLALSMGTSVHIFGWQSSIPLPYALMKHIPLLSVMHTPSRAIVYVYLFWAVIVSFAIKYLYRAYGFKLIRRGLAFFLVSLLLFCDYYSVCAAITPVYCPPAYKTIGKDTEKFGILDLPAYNYMYAARYMMYQTFHALPIVQGYISRRVGKPLISRLELNDLSLQKLQLSVNKVKYIVIHKYLIPLEARGRIRLYKENYRLIYEDEENIVFRVY